MFNFKIYKMKKIITKLILLMVVTFTVTSCLDEDAVDFGQGPIITQFSEKQVTNNFLQDGTGTVYTYEFPIEYQGSDGLALNEDVTITISVDGASSTATEGKEFSLGETSFTIPAGSKTAMASIMVNSAELDNTNPLTAVIQIDTSSQTVSDSNKIAITLQAICPSKLAGTYVFSNGGKAGQVATVIETGPGTYEISEDPYFRGSYPIAISDVCNEVTVTGGYLIDNFGIPQTGSGSVDPVTGNINIIYTAEGYFALPISLIKQ
jgi:hypothetical protein